MDERPIKTFNEFLGEFTNADMENVPDGMCRLMQNCKSQNGKAVKTFGFGDYLYHAYGIGSGVLTLTPQWIGVYSDPHLSATLGTGAGYVLLAYGVDSSTKAVTIKYLDGTTGNWTDINSLVVGSMAAHYHSYSKNPVIANNNIIRFLPGCEDAPGGNEPKGIWLGYIGRTIIDGLYTHGTAAEVAATTKDYEAGFYALDTKIVAETITGGGSLPTIVFTPTADTPGGSMGGSFSTTEAVERSYRISAIYDGICESPLSTDRVTATINSTQLCRLKIQVIANSLNRRITGLKVYRLDSADTGYKMSHYVDFLRGTGKTASVDNGAYGGHRVAYVPGLSTYPFDSGKTYLLGLDGPGSAEKKGTISTASKGYAFSATPNSTGWTCFKISASEFDVDDLWDSEWNLYESTAPTLSVAHGVSGAYGGTKAVIISTGDAEASTYGKYIGGVIKITEATYGDIGGEIVGHIGNAILLKTAPIGYFANEDYLLVSIQDGLYNVIESAADVFDFYVYDYNVTASDEHPYPDDTVCTANGQYAEVAAGMLIQGRVRVDPATANEYYEDHFTYSLPQQLDVSPPSRRDRVPDKDGGPITGIAMSFNSVAFAKKTSAFRLMIPDADDVTTWQFNESVFNRGNLAPDGMIQVGHSVYIVSIDGIYELDPNSIAAADDTALLKMRVSEPINDSFMALTQSQKEAVISGYDPLNNEIVFKFVSTTNVRAFDIIKKTWRTITSAINFSVTGKNQNGSLIIYGSTDLLYSPDYSESVIFSLKPKRTRLSSIRDEVLASLRIICKSVPATLANNIYGNLIGPERISGTSAMSEWAAPANGWAYASDKWNHTTGNTAPLISGVWVPTAGRYYKVVIVVTASVAGSGLVATMGGAATLGSISASGTYTYYVNALGVGPLTITPGSAGTWVGSIVSCSIKEMPYSSPTAGASLTGGTEDISIQKVSYKKRCKALDVEVCESTASTSAVEVHAIELYVH
jgi:hypothetical protein